MKRIIYKNQDNSIAIIVPSDEALSFATIEQISEKDVPHNLPYWIVDASVIPTDRTFRNAWEWDDTVEPDGVGSVFYTFEEIE